MVYKRTRGSSPNADSSTSTSPTRTGPHDEAIVIPSGVGRCSMAEEGSYFTCCNATTATEIAGHVAPAIADEPTKPLLYLYNGGNKYITIDFVTLRVETVNTSASDIYFSVHTTQGEVSRDSGGTAITPVNARSDNPFSSGATVYFGAVVTTPSAFKLHSRTLIRQTINVTEDRYYFGFGHNLVSGPAYVATISDIYRNLPPLCIAPGGEMLFNSVNPSGASAASDYEFMLGYWER
ncbi:MAG TPA: hypothetical protein VFB99_21050 [Vicinamibacterales bacterium]|nr:hypothetical protein [Vicinamibacterales bacterium]